MNRKLLLALMVIGLAVQLHAASGQLAFANNTATKLTNGLTGLALASGNSFRVALYVASDGTIDESLFTRISLSETNCFVAGLFNKGTINTPIEGNTYGMFQVRVWETAYGSSYEAAVAAGSIGGRTALVGKSVILRIMTTLPPSAPVSIANSGLNPIVLTAAAQPSFFINSILVSEGTNGTKDAVFTVTLIPPSASASTVDFATSDGTATAGSDYVATNGTLNFAAGESNKTITVTLTPDPNPESDEELYVTLSNPVGALIGQASGTCIITEVRVVGLRLDAAITFNTVAGHHYTVERTEDMVTWTAVTGGENVVGTGSTATVYDQGVGGQGLRVYRARLLD